MITGAIKETSRDRVYQELGLEFLADRRCSCRRFLLPENYTETLIILLQTYHNAVREGAYLTLSATQNKTKPVPAKKKTVSK